MKQIVILTVILALSPVSIQADTLPLATGEWLPYTSENLEGYGFITEIVTAVLREMQIEPQYTFETWKRCYSLVLRGDVWAAFPYSYTEERADEVLFSDVVGESTTKFFYYGSGQSYAYTTLEDLQPYRIAGVKGYFYEEAFSEAGLNVSYTADETSALKRLQAGRVDLMPLNELVGWALIREVFPDQADQFHTVDTPYDVSELMLVASPQYPGAQEYLEQFNQALQRVKQSETYRDILRKYGLSQP